MAVVANKIKKNKNGNNSANFTDFDAKFGVVVAERC